MSDLSTGESATPEPISATTLVRAALVGTGVEIVASCAVELYDACAPPPFRSATWLAGARGIVVAASAGPALWRRLRADLDAGRASPEEPNPLDRLVGGILTRADRALASQGIPFRRFEAAIAASPRLDFMALGSLVGLGSAGPFGMLIHPEHGAWWALRGAWLVGADVDPPLRHRPPCSGCSAPCVEGYPTGAIVPATPEVRTRCVIGTSSRYDDDQIAYHYGPRSFHRSSEET